MIAVLSAAVATPWRWGGILLGILFLTLSFVALLALTRLRKLEKWVDWNSPERLLVIAPHQDDCVICAGGLGIRNAHLGGVTHIVYLVQDLDRNTADKRRNEVISAWGLAGITEASLEHHNLLPALYEHNPSRLAGAATELAKIINGFNPTVIVMPLFEGGHIHHDLTNYLVSQFLSPSTDVRVLEAPEYSPFVSLKLTPHRIIALCVRWLFGVVAYYGPPDGIDGRVILKLRLTQDELELKRSMLARFESQNGPSLAATRCYPDRFVPWAPSMRKNVPFDFHSSYLHFVLRLSRAISRRWAIMLFPVQMGTIGKEPGITNLRDELV
jgi:LmbE family N-acetylglucosaminyl deacetylase